MRKPAQENISHSHMIILSRLLLTLGGERSAYAAAGASEATAKARLALELKNMRQDEFENLAGLAQANHVIVRGLDAFRELLRDQRSAVQIEWAESTLEAERTRIARATHFLHQVYSAFPENGLDAMVIKSLDHWPDIGSDLDLYTDATPEEVMRLMTGRFQARIAPRSWGDCLARKWNFLIPGLPEPVEIHVGRLGQTGEQDALAGSLMRGSRITLLGGYSFRTTSVPDRLMISVLQRMYRHFYFRLCDIVDTVTLADTDGIDYEALRALAEDAGIWPGVAAYLKIVSDYAMSYRGRGLNLPGFVTEAAHFGGNEVYFSRGFLRVPILPRAAALYGRQLAGVLGRGELHNGVRLGLLPWLATAAVVGQKLTGSDKEIW